MALAETLISVNAMRAIREQIVPCGHVVRRTRGLLLQMIQTSCTLGLSNVLVLEYVIAKPDYASAIQHFLVLAARLCRALRDVSLMGDACPFARRPQLMMVFLYFIGHLILFGMLIE